MSWAAASERQPWVNLGDALSPIMVAGLSGRRIIRRPFKCLAERLGCVGTVGQSFAGSTVHLWGTGMSWRLSADAAAKDWTLPPGTEIHAHAVRGPRTRGVLTGQGVAVPEIYGDPVFLLPRFHRPTITKQHELGVIVHISALAGRHPKEPPKESQLSYQVQPEFRETVRVFSMLCEPTLEHVEARIADILACRRILTTSLHGAVIAEAYGIPWLYFRTSGKGLGECDLGRTDQGLEWRFHDAFAGLGMSRFPYYGQPRELATNWEDAIRAIDRAWSPTSWKPDDLLAAFPLPLDPRIAANQQLNLFADRQFRQTLDDFTSSQFLPPALDAPNFNSAQPVAPAPAPAPAPVPVVTTYPLSQVNEAREAFRNLVQSSGSIPLVWAAGTEAAPHANLGDALSPVILAALSGKGIAQRHFDSRCPRLAAVGTIAHHLRNDDVHLWGPGMNAWANPADPSSPPYEMPKDTRIFAHAVRGPQTADAMRRAGAWVSGVYGDPVWLLPRLYRPTLAPTYELGVIVHLTELDGREPDSRTRKELLRYAIPEELAGTVRIISTITEASMGGLRARLDDILSCKRILSTSLHGLIIAESYGIPSLYWKSSGNGEQVADLAQPGLIDHRFRDAFLGIGRKRLPYIASERSKPSSWEALMGSIDNLWDAPEPWRGGDDLLAALPLDVRGDMWAIPPDHLWSPPLTVF